MRKKRITGRFYLFLLAILVVAFLIARPHFSFGEREALIVSASSAYTKKMDAVILRSERVVSSGTVARVEYVATEGSLLSEGDTIAYLYSTGYSESELVKLESIRQNIQAYHKSILNNIVDADLNRLDRIVDMKALELKSLVTHKTAGNLLDLTRQLEGAMVNRQEYMRSNKREDPKLNKLYNDENTRLNSIASWRTVARADSQGVISFYMDGYESTLSPENLDALTAAELRAVLSGAAHAGEASRLTDIYRLVDQNEWYVVILTDGASWNPVLDQQYSLQFEGFEDIAYTAKVTRVKKSDGEVMAVFQVTDPIGPLLYQRTGKAYMSITLTGLAVKSEAIYSQNGQTGVWLYDVPGGTFVPVEVLSDDGSSALIQPVSENALQSGQAVLIK
jgi:putative membrane fusion protein